MRKAPIIVSVTMILSMVFGPDMLRTSSAAPAQKPIDPVCVEFCRQELYSCILDALTNGENEKRCISVYRRCIADCKK